MKEYKYRHELKFKISNSAAEVLKQKLLRGVYEYKKETIPFVEIYKTL